ncbi:MAG: L-2-amino-thiazoline-4-carboxylic acid hydrolase [Candidatus Thorarchaeota archaeon]
MKIKIRNTWNPKAIEKFKLGDRLGQAFSRTNSTLKYVDELSPSVREKFVDALVKWLTDAVGDYSIQSAILVPEMFQELAVLKEYPKLQQAVYQFTCNMLQLPLDRKPSDEEVEVFSLDNAKAHERLSYYFVKSLIDILGDRAGVELWKDVVGLRLRDENIEHEKAIQEKLEKGEPLRTLFEINEGAMKRWDRIGLGNYVYAQLDENKVLFRFDKCHTHEALKDLNDPYIAYLCSCYIGEHPMYNFGRKHMRRTQTLHQGTFCDELYWMTDVHDNPEQPSLKFTKSLGKKE